MNKTKNRFVTAVLMAGLSLIGIDAYAQTEDPDYIQLTQIAYENGDMEKAYQLLGVLEQKYPDNAYIQTERGGWQLYREGDINAALATLSKAVKTLPDDANLLTLRGVAFYRKGLVEKAIEDQEAAIAISPEPIMFYINLGNYYYALEQYGQALAVFLKGVELQPAEAETYSHAFAAYAKLNNAAAAKRLFDSGLSQAGIDIGFLRCYYGNFLMRIQQFDEAAQQYQAAYDMPEPHMYAEDYHNAAISYMKIGQLDTAIGFIDIAIFYDPHEVVYLTNKADMAMNKEDWDTVIESAAKAIELDDQNALAHMYMAIGLKWGPQDLEKSAWYEAKAKELNQNSNGN